MKYFLFIVLVFNQSLKADEETQEVCNPSYTYNCFTLNHPINKDAPYFTDWLVELVKDKDAGLTHLPLAIEALKQVKVYLESVQRKIITDITNTNIEDADPEKKFHVEITHPLRLLSVEALLRKIDHFLVEMETSEFKVSEFIEFAKKESNYNHKFLVFWLKEIARYDYEQFH